jgi:hypothetical protein
VFLFTQRFQLLYGEAKKSSCHSLEAPIIVFPNSNKDFHSLIRQECFLSEGFTFTKQQATPCRRLHA